MEVTEENEISVGSLEEMLAESRQVREECQERLVAARLTEAFVALHDPKEAEVEPLAPPLLRSF